MVAVFVINEIYGAGFYPIPTNLKYPNPKREHPAIGVKITNTSWNHDLLLLDVSTHGVNAEKQAIRIKPGEWEFFGGYSPCKPIGMCYEIKFVKSDCKAKDCAGNILETKGFSIKEEYIKNC